MTVKLSTLGLFKCLMVHNVLLLVAIYQLCISEYFVALMAILAIIQIAINQNNGTIYPHFHWGQLSQREKWRKLGKQLINCKAYDKFFFVKIKGFHLLNIFLEKKPLCLTLNRRIISRVYLVQYPDFSHHTHLFELTLLFSFCYTLIRYRTV